MPILSNAKYELFAQAVAQGMSASAAYVAAGYEAHGGNAGRLSKKEFIVARVAELMAEGAERAGVTISSVVTELAKIGFSDIRKLVRWSSNLTEVGENADTGEPTLRAFNQVALIDSDAIDDDTAGAIAEISQTRDGAMKVKLYDKRAALVDLGRHLGMFKDKVEHSGPGGGPIETETKHGFADLDADERNSIRAILERRASQS